MSNIERERIFLLKRLPPKLNSCKNIYIEIGDLTADNDVSLLKVRQKGDLFELIKKETISKNERKEYVIPLNKEEFELLLKIAVRKHSKKRFFFPLNNYTCEIDVYLDDMLGYVRAEVEFETLEEMEDFVPPDWFGKEITEINHEIHKNLGTITFQTMLTRLKERSININKLTLKD